MGYPRVHVAVRASPFSVPYDVSQYTGSLGMMLASIVQDASISYSELNCWSHASPTSPNTWFGAKRLANLQLAKIRIWSNLKNPPVPLHPTFLTSPRIKSTTVFLFISLPRGQIGRVLRPQGGTANHPLSG